MPILKIQYPGSLKDFQEQLENYIAFKDLPIGVVNTSDTELVLVISKMGTSKLYFNVYEDSAPSGLIATARLIKTKLAWLHKAMSSKISGQIIEIAEAIGAKIVS